MKTLRIVCNFLLSLVQALFPRGLKGRHSSPGDPVAGADSTVVAYSEADGGGTGCHRRAILSIIRPGSPPGTHTPQNPH